MSEIHVHRIRSFLDREFKDLIDLSDVKNRNENEILKHFLSRSQAALALSKVAGIKKELAANSIIDGFDDNGIDAIHYDEEAGVVYLIQSKWDQTGQKSPETGDVLKFINGFKDFIFTRFERFNNKFRERQENFEQALESPNVTFSLLIVYTGVQPLSKQATQNFDDLLHEINNPIEVVSYRPFNQNDLYSAISGRMDETTINLDVTLYEWGQIKEPFQAYYGQVSSEDIARWYHEHNRGLLVRNLRNFKGDTVVNLSIKTTLIREPEKFWYFNNGITVLCNKITKKPKYASSRERGEFTFEGVSVVNGAQTVGSVSAAVYQNFPKAKDAKVLVRFISLEDCPPGFAPDVTTATNTQNRIEKRDFASLDPTQERLKVELALDLNKLYVYRSGDSIPLPVQGCTIDDATVALACAHPEVRLAAEVKSNISVLWDDITKPPYTLLFNPKLTPSRLWYCVEISRAVENKLAVEKEHGSSKKRLIAIHGNRFILHRVFQNMPLNKFDVPGLIIGPILQLAEQETTKALELVTTILDEKFGDSYLNSFFKASKNCEELIYLLPKIPTPYEKIPYYLDSLKTVQPTLFDIK